MKRYSTIRCARRCLVWSPCFHLTTTAGVRPFTQREVPLDGEHRQEVTSSAPAPATDDTQDWLRGYVDKAVISGRQTKEAAAYFESILHDQPEFMDCVREARRMMGGQNPEEFTKYQQGLFGDRMSKYISRAASGRMMHAQAEESGMRRFTQDGTPTGENYWMEAGNTLASPSVPPFVKDEVMQEMQRNRKPNSPAFETPAEEAGLSEKDANYAAHLRQQKKRLLGGTEFK